jgi:CHAT domain-containing protein/Tfp pilus assembly protein PilF
MRSKNTFILITGVIISLIGLFLFPLFVFAQGVGVSITLNDGTVINLPETEFEPSLWIEKEIEKKDFLSYTLDSSFLYLFQQDEVIKYIKERADQIYLTGQYPRLIEEMSILKALALTQGKDNLFAESLYYQGRVWYRQGKDDDAQRVLLQALEKYQTLQDKPGLLKVYIALAGVYQSYQDLDKSEEYVQKAQSLAEELQDTGGKASSLLSFGIISFYKGDLEQAEKYFLDAYALAVQVENVEVAALSLNNLAYVYVEKGEYKKAQEICESSLQISQKAGFKCGEFAVKVSLARLYHEAWGDSSQALQYLIDCQRLSQEMGFSYQEAWVFNNMGIIYLDKGDFQNAKKVLEKAEGIIQYYNVPADIGIYTNLGSLYLQTNDLKKAENYITRVLRLSTSLNQPLSIADAWMNLGVVYNNEERYKDALAAYNEAMKIYEELGLKPRIAALMNNIASLNQHQGYLELALEAQLEALKIHQELNMPFDLALDYGNLGTIYLDRKEVTKSEEYFRKGLELAQKLNYSNMIWYCQTGLGRILLEQGKREESLTYFKQAIDILEGLREKLTSTEMRRGFFENKLLAYDLTVEILWDLGRFEEAFNYSERARARSFLDILGGTMLNVKDEDKEMVSHLQDLETRITSLQEKERQERAKPAEEQNSAYLEELQEILKKLQQNYYQVKEDLSHYSPEVASLVTVDPLNLNTLRAVLDKEIVLLDYYITGNRILVWVIGENGIKTKEINIKDINLNQKIEEAREAFTATAGDYQKICEELYQILFAPVKTLIGDKITIGIIPHRSLFYLPFQGLKGEEGFLVDRYNLFYVPSASVYSYCLSKNRENKESYLGFGNPSFEGEDLPPLPLSAEEVKMVAPIFPYNDVFIDKEATETKFKEICSNFDIIHLSTHGLADDQRPLFSKICLSKDEQNDGEVRAYEVFSLNLKANLVVLGACETGLGKLSEAEGLVGLVRSFLYAGTPTVIASLWSVYDKPTMELFINFFKYWKQEGLSKAEALSRAQRELAKEYGYPVAWAGFILIGDSK